MIERIEAVYSYGSAKLFRGDRDITVHNTITDFFWDKYGKEEFNVLQALSTLLYSLEKLRGNNEDISFFYTFVTERRTKKFYLVFLLLREIFQNLTRITFFGKIFFMKEMEKLKLILLELLLVRMLLRRC